MAWMVFWVHTVLRIQYNTMKQIRGCYSVAGAGDSNIPYTVTANCRAKSRLLVYRAAALSLLEYSLQS